MSWLRRAWNEGDTQMWVPGFLVLLAVIGTILAFTVPPL